MSTHREHVNNLLSVLGEATASLATFVRLSMHSVAESVRQNMDRHEQERPHAKRNERPEEASGRNQRFSDDWQDRDWQGQHWNGGRRCACKNPHPRAKDGDREKSSLRTVGVMAVRVDTAAKHFCEVSGWGISNLQLQKLLYLAQVEHVARTGTELLSGAQFQAWDYGPVIPTLYRRLKMFGSDCVSDVFYDARTLRTESESYRSLGVVWGEFGAAEPGELIELTHWELGAWAQKYEPGVKNTPITLEDIKFEARNRTKFADQWRALTAA